MSKSRNLKPLLRGAVTLVMASSGATWSCSDVGPGIEDDPGFVSTDCGDPVGDLLAGLTPEPEQDYVELRYVDPGGSRGTAGHVGKACDTAQDEAACLTALEELTATSGFRLGTCRGPCFDYYLTTTEGDTVRALDSTEEARSLLGTIDSPQEAMLVVALEGFDVRCGDGGAKPQGASFEVQGFTYEGCDGETRYLFDVTADGAVSQKGRVVVHEANPNCVVGRRPAGLGKPARRCGLRPVANYLAHAAQLEAASVYAFRHVERELASHGAPRRLLTAARRAAADEIRHARVTARLARRFGVRRLERPRIAPTAHRDLESMLLDNAIEGCVRETFGAAVGIWQAKHAVDPHVARAMGPIAADELRHAQLAWEIGAWFEPKLDAASLRRLRQARTAAIAELRAELEQPLDASIVRTLGVPSVEMALRLHGELERTVWV